MKTNVFARNVHKKLIPVKYAANFDECVKALWTTVHDNIKNT